MKVNCTSCDKHPDGQKCLVYEGKCYCNRRCLMAGLKNAIIIRIDELRETHKPINIKTIAPKG